ncbi:MAG: geranylgeranylglycerol-phosphate geranylgeranyltransferase [Bacteroidota bacterium]
MKILIGFLRLVRWPNLVFIALTQLLFEYCIYEPVFGTGSKEIGSFYLLVLASVLIAAAGYIINDYFDLDIDQINKPNKVVVNAVISRRWVIFWHMFLSMLGLYFTMFALHFSEYWHLILANMFSVIFLWIYSTSLKKQLLIGNLLISILTAWVIGILYFSKYPLSSFPNSNYTFNQNARFFRISILYTGFAFVISLIREVIKDLEDMEGDRKYGGKTMPIEWGVNASKVFISVWLIVLISTLVILQLYVIQLGWWLSILYCLILIITPLLYVFKKLFTAKSTTDFHHLSVVIKLVMLTGILSMAFFRLYH